MKGNEIFAGKSLKAADLGTSQPVVTIEKVESKKFDDGMKAVIHFRGKDKVLICNKTNWNSIVEITGQEDSDNWTGKRIRLVVARVDFQGQRVPAIRVDAPNGDNRSTPPPAPPPRREPEHLDIPNDDDIPF